VRVDDAAGELRCEVVNSRAARRGTAGAGVGLGLISMEERVGALDGELVAGPTEDGGFRVVATMPLDRADV